MGCLLWLRQSFLFLISFHLHFHTTSSLLFSSNFSSSQHLCSHDQSVALFQFKESFSINTSASWDVCRHPKTELWKEGTDCCSWDGVTCDKKTGQVLGLDLACSTLYGTLHSNSTLFSLHHLQKLDLSNNHFNGSHISSHFGQFPNLTHLSLHNTGFSGQVPSEISQLSKLVSLYLDGNFDLTLEPISLHKLVQNLTKLRALDLSGINMSLVIPNSFMNLSSSLSFLSLMNCGLQGKFPGNIFLRPNLETLYLFGNEGLTGSFCSSNVSSVLAYLDLSHTRISFFFENNLINNLKSLKHLFLSKVNISIKSNLILLGNLTELIQLDLRYNNLCCEIPSSLGNLKKLTLLYLGTNNFAGKIPDSFGNLTKLEILDIANNQLLGSIPSQMSKLSNLIHVYLYANFLTGTIPTFFFALPSLRTLFLNNNLFTGNISQFQYNSLLYLDLAYTHLHGPIPSSIFKQDNLIILVLSSIKLTGEISSSICNLKSLQILDLSDSSLSGFIPQCLGNFSNNLSELNLGMNNLEGTVPSTFLEGNSLEYLNLNGNELKGKIPRSIINCAKLKVLDLGNNKIADAFPNSLEMLRELKILVLRCNKLQGFVKGPNTNYAFSNLRIFDLSSNNFSGPFPTSYFNGFEAMMTLDEDMIYLRGENFTGYNYSVSMTWKGLATKFSKIQSTLTSIDLSDNNFIGDLPDSIGKLKALEQINLSHNSLTGYIQPSLANLSNLESLDLSSNLLNGRIPKQLIDLTFLQVLNLSHNQLEGPIPKGKQFNTFDRRSFEGNLGLCGFPMPKECSSGETPPLPPSYLKGDYSTLFEEGFGWKAVAIGYGCGFVFGAIIGYIVFRTRKPAWFVRMVGGWPLQKTRRTKNARRNPTRRN